MPQKLFDGADVAADVCRGEHRDGSVMVHNVCTVERSWFDATCHASSSRGARLVRVL